MAQKKRGRPRKWVNGRERLWFICSPEIAEAIDRMVDDVQQNTHNPIYRSDVIRTLVIESLEKYGYLKITH